MIKSSDISAGAAGLLSLATTGIGSLPQLDAEAALDAAFAVDIPYFPTLPQLDPREGMLKQGLSGFPGVYWKSADSVRFEVSVWDRDRQALAEELGRAFNRNYYQDFLPAVTAVPWESFLDRLRAHPSPWAKVQLVGPVTATLALQGLEAMAPDQALEVVALLSEWLFAKALAMGAALRRAGKKVIFFLDEPGLCGDLKRIERQHALEQLRERVTELENYGYLVGLHCCGSFDSRSLLSWPLDILSFDTALALESVLRWPEALREWFGRGGRLALGAVPTHLTTTWNLTREVKGCWASFVAALGEEAARELLRSSLLTPACGLGLRTMEETTQVFAQLKEFKDRLKEKL